MSGHDPGCWATDELAAGVVVVDRAAAAATSAATPLDRRASAHVDSYVQLCLFFSLRNRRLFARRDSIRIIFTVSPSTRYRPGILMPTG